MGVLNAAKGLVGMSDVDKAILEVVDQTSISKAEIENKKQASKEPVNVRDLMSAANAIEMASSVPKSVTNSVPGLSDVSKLTDVKKGLDGVKYLRFSVLYNPERIRLNGHGTSVKQKMSINAKTGTNVMEYATYPSNLELRIPLILDKTYSEKISGALSQSLSLSQLGRDTADAIKSSFSDDAFMGNVRKEVEGLASLFRSPYTRLVTFYWSRMEYTGILTSMSANYVMFDPSGHPTRATVDLNVILADPNNSNLMDNGLKDGPWKKFYKEAFEGKTAVNGANFTNNAMGLLGL
ncbi:MAG: hypothetical protein K6F00_02230 [Lachnospiraceae bacterium]|nr:hypothetical protein [Lachnospiraceae bacterium]